MRTHASQLPSGLVGPAQMETRIFLITLVFCKDQQVVACLWHTNGLRFARAIRSQSTSDKRLSCTRDKEVRFLRSHFKRAKSNHFASLLCFLCRMGIFAALCIQNMC